MRVFLRMNDVDFDFLDIPLPELSNLPPQPILGRIPCLQCRDIYNLNFGFYSVEIFII